MSSRSLEQVSGRRFTRVSAGALFALLTVAVTLVWAHAGHDALPLKGAKPIKEGDDVVGVALSRESRNILDVETVEVVKKAGAERLLAYATVVTPWQQHAYVTTRVPGRITHLSVRPGDTVTVNTVLAEVESQELENLELELLNAQNDIKLSEKLVAELKPLADQQAIPEREYREAWSKHRQNENAQKVAQAKWLSLGLSQELLDRLLRENNSKLVRTLPIKSPVAGTVIHADLAIGKVVDPGEHLFEVMDLSTVWVQIGVLEEDLHKVEVGQPVELRLTAYPGKVFKSKDFAVRVKGSYLDPQTHLGTVWAELANPPLPAEPLFLPGMHGEARVLLPSPKDLPTVPGEAVVADGAERYVLVETTPDDAKESEYRRQNVVLGLRTPEGVQIVQGDVFVTDRVVTRGSHELASFFVQGVLRLSPQAAQNIGLRVEPVRRRVVEKVIEIDGGVDVLPDHRAAASSQLPGTLTRIRVERGQRVKAGEPLADIASLELQNMQLELLRSQLQLELEEETLDRLKKADQAVARKQLWEAESHRNESRNRRDSLKRKLVALGLDSGVVDGVLKDRKPVEALPLRAPIDGVVVQFDKVLGQVIKAEEPLFQLHDLKHTWVQGYLSERDLSDVRIGQEARVRLVADPGFLANGRVIRSGRVFGAEDRTLSVWVEMRETTARRQPEVHDNMAARLTLTVERPAPTLAVPLGAVIREGTRAYVFVQSKDGGFERRPVDTGRADDQYVEILRGLEADETVAVSGAEGLQTAYASLR